MPLNGPSSSASNASNALSPYEFDKFLTCQWDWDLLPSDHSWT